MISYTIDGLRQGEPERIIDATRLLTPQNRRVYDTLSVLVITGTYSRKLSDTELRMAEEIVRSVTDGRITITVHRGLGAFLYG